MNLIDYITINRFHEDRIKEFGTPSVKALGWSDAEAQQKRFELLSGIANLNSCVLMDAGCGYGDLYPFLSNIYPGIQYIGTEQNSSFLDVAVERYGNKPNAKFLLGDFTSAQLPQTDYLLCSGALSYHSHDPSFIEKAIEKLFHSCRYGMGFNLLKQVKNPGGIIVTYDPEEIMNFCRQLTPQIQLYDHYLPDDFTIFLYH
jgi:SAM-dependent methyltransferase